MKVEEEEEEEVCLL